MIKMKYLIIVFMLILSGCSSYILTTYSQQPQSDFEYDGLNYVISERADLGKIFIRPTVGSAFALGGKSTVLGKDGIQDEEKQVLKSYFKSLNRGCVLENPHEIQNGQNEFSYRCK